MRRGRRAAILTFRQPSCRILFSVLLKLVTPLTPPVGILLCIVLQLESPPPSLGCVSSLESCIVLLAGSRSCMELNARREAGGERAGVRADEPRPGTYLTWLSREEDTSSRLG